MVGKFIDSDSQRCIHYDDLKLEPSDGTGPNEIDLRGEAAGVGTEMEPPLQFQPLLVGSSEVMTLTIENLHMPAAATIATSIDDPSYKILTTAQNTCGAGIARGKSCTLPVQYAPLTPGDHIGTLTLTPSEGAVSTVELRGASESALSTPVPGNIYVLDTNNRRVQFFGPSGNYLGQGPVFSTSIARWRPIARGMCGSRLPKMATFKSSTAMGTF